MDSLDTFVDAYIKANEPVTDWFKLMKEGGELAVALFAEEEDEDDKREVEQIAKRLGDMAKIYAPPSDDEDDDDEDDDDKVSTMSNDDDDDDEYRMNYFEDRIDCPFYNQEDNEDDDDDDDDDDNAGERLFDEDEIRPSFRQICKRLKENDETLVEYKQRNREFIDYCKDMHKLGKALKSNTHLQSLSITMQTCVCKCKLSTREARVLRRGISQASSLRQLEFTCRCTELQKRLLQGVGMSSTIHQLKLRKSPVHIPTLTQLLLVPSTDDNNMPQKQQQQPSLPLNNNKMPDFCCQLKQLCLKHCNVSNIDMLHLSIALESNHSLVELRLDRNHITNVGVIYFCQHWRDDSPLVTLSLSYNDIDAKGAMHLLRASVHHAALQTLALNGNRRIGHDGLCQMGNFLPHLVLQHLEVESYFRPQFCVCERAQEAACCALVNGLQRNTTLVSFLVGCNKLGENGAHWIIQAAANHPSLEVLSLELDETVGLPGITWIATLLPNVRLKHLNLNFTCPSHWSQPLLPKAIAAANALLHGIQNNETLTQFDIWELPERWMKPIRFHVELNRALRPLLKKEGVPPAMLALALAKFTRKGQISQVYYSLLEQPWLVAVAAVATNQAGTESSVPTVAMEAVGDDNNNNMTQIRRRKLSHPLSPPPTCSSKCEKE